MQSKLSGLFRQQEDTRQKRRSIEADLAEIQAAFAAEETASLVEERSVNEKLKQKLADAASKHAEITAKADALERAIADVQRQEVAARWQREAEALEVFKVKAEAKVKKLHQALFAARNAAQDFFELTEKQEAVLPRLFEFLFPPADPLDAMADMQQRFAQMSLLNGCVSWINDDFQHSRNGPQKPRDWR